jgi:dihydrofolate reductase
VRTLTYFVATTLDGFIAAPDGSFDAFSREPTYLQALFARYPDTAPAPARAPFGLQDAPPTRFDTVIMGRATYDVGATQGLMSPYPHLRQIVCSRRARVSNDPAIEQWSDDLSTRVRALKASRGIGLWLCGGGQLASALIDEIDALMIKVNPVVLGGGIPLFAQPAPLRRFVLTDVERFDNGVLLNTYTRAT